LFPKRNYLAPVPSGRGLCNLGGVALAKFLDNLRLVCLPKKGKQSKNLGGVDKHFWFAKIRTRYGKQILFIQKKRLISGSFCFRWRPLREAVF